MCHTILSTLISRLGGQKAVLHYSTAELASRDHRIIADHMAHYVFSTVDGTLHAAVQSSLSFGGLTLSFSIVPLNLWNAITFAF